MADSEPDTVVPLPTVPVELPAIYRHGLGYRGVWQQQGILLELGQLHASHGDLSGLLSVQHGQSTPFVAKFNVASLTGRTQVANHLLKGTDYKGWPTILDHFCRHVIRLEQEGRSPFVSLGAPNGSLAGSYLLEPILPSNVVSIIYGASGSMKSTLVAGMAVSVSTGIPLLGWEPLQSGPVLVLDWEADQEEWAVRVDAIARGMGVQRPDQISYRRCDQRLPQMIESVASQVNSTGAVLAILDSVSWAIPPPSQGGSDPNDAVKLLFEACKLVPITWCWVDHLSGESTHAKPGTVRPLGGVGKVNQSRSSYQLCREERAGSEGTQVGMYHYNTNRGAKQEPQGLRVRHEADRISFERCQITAPDLAEGVSAPRRIHQLLGSEGSLFVNQIVEELGLGQSTVSQALRRNTEEFFKMKDGRWGLKA